MMPIYFLVILVVLFVALLGRASPSARRNVNYIYGDANVGSIEIRVRESIPAQVTVTARGELEDACTEIDETTVQRTNHTFHVRIATRRPADEICAQVLAPFEKTIELDTAGLPRGVYMVEVNGVTDTFAL